MTPIVKGTEGEDNMTKEVLIKIDKNGTKYWGSPKTCPRCGGAGGADKWKFTGWTCFACGGSGKAEGLSIRKEYTPEHQAKLDAAKEKRDAKKAAERKTEQQQEFEKAAEKRQEWMQQNGFDKDGFTYVFTGKTFHLKDQLKEMGARFCSQLGWHIDHPVEGFKMVPVHMQFVTTIDSWGNTHFRNDVDYQAYIQEKIIENGLFHASEWIGEIGKRIELELTLVNVSTFNYKHGFGAVLMTIYNLEDAAGNVFVWKTSGILLNEETDREVAVGEKHLIRATVKEHCEYKGTKQTVLTRLKVM